MYDEVKRNNKPSAEEAGKNHPGPITNDEDLCMPDNGVNLKGTGTIE